MAVAEPDPGEIIVAWERAALERWGAGDPDGFIEISAAEVSYFDPFTERRIDGLDSLRSWYDQLSALRAASPQMRIAPGA